MPANSKYLSTSWVFKITKIITGFFLGYLITALLHMCLAILAVDGTKVLVTAIISFPLVWCALFVVVYLFKNPWNAVFVYTVISIVLLLWYILVTL